MSAVVKPRAVLGPRKGRASDEATDLKHRSASSPCIGCRHELRCKAETLACERLVLFMRTSASPERLRCAPTQPSRSIFERANAPIKRKAPPVFRRPVDDDEAGAD